MGGCCGGMIVEGLYPLVVTLLEDEADGMKFDGDGRTDELSDAWSADEGEPARFEGPADALGWR